MKLELGTDEVKTIIEILRYSVDNCPVESITNEVEISVDGVEDLVQKLRNALQSNTSP
jgi:hypothetical protein